MAQFSRTNKNYGSIFPPKTSSQLNFFWLDNIFKNWRLNFAPTTS
jgi:hypothetical protein